MFILNNSVFGIRPYNSIIGRRSRARRPCSWERAHHNWKTIKSNDAVVLSKSMPLLPKMRSWILQITPTIDAFFAQSMRLEVRQVFHTIILNPPCNLPNTLYALGGYGALFKPPKFTLFFALIPYLIIPSLTNYHIQAWWYKVMQHNETIQLSMWP